MNERWVVNASPIIALANCGYLDLIAELCSDVLIPQAVIDEVVAGPPNDPARRQIESGWGVPVAPRSVEPTLLEWGLGPGETSVLAIALERRPAIAVLDDAAARTCARAFDVPTIGTLAIIVRAKKQRLIPSAAAVMQELRESGFYLNNDVVLQALRHVGEDWVPN